jgi:hypothetical protein
MPNPWLNEHKSTAAMNYFFSNSCSIFCFLCSVLLGSSSFFCFLCSVLSQQNTIQKTKERTRTQQNTTQKTKERTRTQQNTTQKTKERLFLAISSIGYLFCLFFDIRLLITPLISSNFSWQPLVYNFMRYSCSSLHSSLLWKWSDILHTLNVHQTNSQ